MEKVQIHKLKKTILIGFLSLFYITTTNLVYGQPNEIDPELIKKFQFTEQDGQKDLPVPTIPCSEQDRRARLGESKTWGTPGVDLAYSGFGQVVDHGVYRVEVFIHYLGKRRSWIISNPIYIR